MSLNLWPTRRWENQNRKLPTRQVLLIAKVLIRSDKGIERYFCGIEEVTIPQSVPAHLIGGRNIVTHQLVTQRCRRSLLKEDSHVPQRGVNLRSSCDETPLRVAQNSRDLLAMSIYLKTEGAISDRGNERSLCLGLPTRSRTRPPEPHTMRRVLNCPERRRLYTDGRR